MLKMVRTKIKVKGSKGKTSQKDKCDRAPSFVHRSMSPVQQHMPVTQRLESDPFSGLDDEDFDQMMSMAVGETPNPHVVMTNPRRVSISSPSLRVPEYILSGGNGMHSRPKPMSRLARRDRSQVSEEASNWMVPSRPTSIDIEPLMLRPLPFVRGPSNVTDVDPSSADEFSLFIGQTIQDPH